MGKYQWCHPLFCGYNEKMTSKTISDNIISSLNKPSRYLGNEINSIHKDILKAELKIALVFPDLYDIGMSNLGMQILYSLLNNMEGVSAERVYMPGEDYEALLKRDKSPVCSIESKYPLPQFDILGFSMQYEMCYSTVTAILSLSDIPLYSKDRGEVYPLIIGGGPAGYNPEPVADIFDLIVIGDGEEVMPEILERYKIFKRERLKKEEILSELSKVRGVYIPAFFKPVYDDEGGLKMISSLKDGYPYVEKRIFYGLNQTSHLLSPIVPYAEVVHDRFTVEVDRGCTQGCRFCQAGYIYRPFRCRDNSVIETMIEEGIKRTGYEEVSLSSLNIGKHCDLGDLIENIVDRFSDKRVAVSLPSIRADAISKRCAREIARIRKTGFTLVPEAGSQRLRNIINKDLSEEDIINGVNRILSMGWDSLKLYFMIGLPFEDMNDVTAIHELCKKIVSTTSEKSFRLKNINVSVSSFVPKPHTPFQRVSQEGIEELMEKQRLLRSLFAKSRNITLKMHDARLSFIEGVFARGDRRLTKALVHSSSLGCKLDGWTEHFNFDRWMIGFNETSIDPDTYVRRERANTEILPWSHIKTGVSDRFLEAEYERAKTGIITKDCRIEVCSGCGVLCDDKTEKYIETDQEEIGSELPEKASDIPYVPQKVYKYRIKFQKKGFLRFLSHLELMKAMQRGLNRADISVAYSNGYHPHPKIIFDQALPVGMESMCEFMDIGINEEMSADLFKDRLTLALPSDLSIIDLFVLADSDNKITAIVKKGVYYIILKKYSLGAAELSYDVSQHNAHIDNLLSQGSLYITKKKDGIAKDIRPAIDQVSCTAMTAEDVILEARLISGGSYPFVSPYQLMQGIYNINDFTGIDVKKTDSIFL